MSRYLISIFLLITISIFKASSLKCYSCETNMEPFCLNYPNDTIGTKNQILDCQPDEVCLTRATFKFPNETDITIPINNTFRTSLDRKCDKGRNNVCRLNNKYGNCLIYSKLELQCITCCTTDLCNVDFPDGGQPVVTSSANMLLTKMIFTIIPLVFSFPKLIF